jgi:hypothetical protein
MREEYFNSLASSREGRILEEKIRDYQKILKKLLNILRMVRKLKKNLVILRANLTTDRKIVNF